MKWLELALIIAKLLACTAYANAGDFWAADWTGVRICVGDPSASIRGTSPCHPCNLAAGDAMASAQTYGYLCGLAEFVGSKPVDIAIVRAADGEPTPYFEVVVQGDVVRRVDRYRGNFSAEILPLLPRRQQLRTTARTTRTVQAAPRQSGPRWNWPGDLAQHLASEHGYQMSYLRTLSAEQLRTLHDNAHNGVQAQPTIGTPRITSRAISEPIYVQSTWVETPVRDTTRFYLPPVNYYAMPPQQTYRARGYQAFGVPLFGSYQSSGCVGGVCR